MVANEKETALKEDEKFIILAILIVSFQVGNIFTKILT